MAEPVSLSVVVCAHNEERHLQEQLNALLAQQWEGTWDVVVVDNRSTDTTAELVTAAARRNPRVRLVSAAERRWSGRRVNVGVRGDRQSLVGLLRRRRRGGTRMARSPCRRAHAS